MSGVDSEVVLIDDISTIPPPIEAPLYRPVKVADGKIVYFDIETTSLHSDCDIIQLSGFSNGRLFNSYVWPEQKISQGASDVTGIVQCNGKLFYNGKEITCVTIHKCLLNFIDWCRVVSDQKVI